MGPQELDERCVRNPTQLSRPQHPPRAVDASLLGVPTGHTGRQLGRDDWYVGSGPKVEYNAVDLTVSRIYARGHGHAPIRARKPDPPSQRLAAGENGIQQRKGARRQFDEALARRHSHGGGPNSRDERRVAVDHEVTGSSAETRGTPFRGTYNRRQDGAAGF